MQQLIFYDQPEYLRIVLENPFWKIFSLGHFPIHPIFLGILWLLIKLLPVNAIAMLFGLVSIFIFYKISKSFLATLIFLLFPAVWIINTNLMVESLALTFFLAGIYFFISKNKPLFFISLFLMVGIHLESIVWIPVIFLVPYLFESKIKKKEQIEYIKIALFTIFVSAVFYASLYYFSGRVISGTTEQLSTYFSSGILRMARNSWLTFATDFGSLTLPVLLILIFKNIRTKKIWLAWTAFFVLVGLIAANWQGDFMGRRIIFAAPILSLAIYKYLGKKSIFVIIYLLPIVIANIILYSNGSPFTISNIPKNQVLVETHYLKPFTKYNGIVLWIGESNLGKIDDYLKNGKRVFLTKQAVTAPYQLLVGNNYHITSLGKVGDSESRFLFKKYEVDPYNNVYELKLFNGNISPNAGEPIISYNKSFWGRLVRRRIDYGDFGTWIWAIVTNHRDPTGWTYLDVRGI